MSLFLELSLFLGYRTYSHDLFNTIVVKIFLFSCVLAIPALRPIVQDLFTSQSQSRPDSAKDLDTQREVMVSMLLRVVHYPEVVINECYCYTKRVLN